MAEAIHCGFKSLNKVNIWKQFNYCSITVLHADEHKVKLTELSTLSLKGIW